MDAKPQRPTRALKVYGDENAIPNGGAQKTIHHRNKSSPALSTVANHGTWKGTAKRTAFGDVSNIAAFTRPSKDDSALELKNNLKLVEKVNVWPAEKKSITLQRPAQRPLSVSGTKSILSSVTNIVRNHTTEVSKPVQTTVIPPVAQETHETSSRPSAKDALPVLKEQPPSGVPALLPLSAPVPPVHREDVRVSSQMISQNAIEPRLRRSQSKISRIGEPVPAESVIHEQALATDPVAQSDGVYIDENGAIQIYEFEHPTDHIEETVELAGVRIPSQLPKAIGPMPTESVALTDLPVAEEKIESVQKHVLPPVSEPEEYWDEDGADNYDEEGYVTARSFKSRTDNTTGNATIVLFPKVTQRVKKEIAAAKLHIEASKTVEELEDEAWDTTMVAEYGDEIFQYMKELEIKMLPNAHYMDNQAEIQWSMRAVLMDWIVQVHHRFNLLPETLFLCVNCIDRFLSCKVVSLGKLQLVGATAILIAAKYEEIDCPSVQEIVYMVDSGYTVDEILKAERFMLSMLQFELGGPGPMSFLRRISKADDYDLETRTLAKYFLEITIMDERFVGSPPSFLSAGAHCLARMMLRKGSWSPAHVYYSNYTYSQLFSLVLLMLECCEDARKHHCAIFDKYTDKRYKRASQFAETEMRKGFQVLDVASHNSPYLNNAYDSQPAWEMRARPMGEVC